MHTEKIKVAVRIRPFLKNEIAKENVCFVNKNVTHDLINNSFRVHKLKLQIWLTFMKELMIEFILEKQNKLIYINLKINIFNLFLNVFLMYSKDLIRPYLLMVRQDQERLIQCLVKILNIIIKGHKWSLIFLSFRHNNLILMKHH